MLRDGELTAFSQDEDVNPSTYKTLGKPGYWGVDAIGKVWAEILWVVSQGVIEKHGFSNTLFHPKPLADGMATSTARTRVRWCPSMGTPLWFSVLRAQG